MHLGGNRRQVPLTNESLSIVIYVKLSHYAMLRRIKRCKHVLCLVLHRTKKDKNLQTKNTVEYQTPLRETRRQTCFRQRVHHGKPVFPCFRRCVHKRRNNNDNLVVLQNNISFFFLTLMRRNKRHKFQVIPCQDMLDVEHGEILGIMSEDSGRPFCEFWATKLILSGFGTT